MLSNVKHDGTEWLDRSQRRARYHGQLLLDEVTAPRLPAHSGVRQGAEELTEWSKSSSARDSAVLRRGRGNVESRSTGHDPLHWTRDHGSSDPRVSEYGRERSVGGADLDGTSVVVDRASSRNPERRPAACAVTIMRSGRAAVRTTEAPTDGSRSRRAPPHQPPGVDIGALQALVADCGGPLWRSRADGRHGVESHRARRGLDRPPAGRCIDQATLGETRSCRCAARSCR